MSQPCQPPCLSSTFRIFFDAALQDYKDKTGITLTDHPIAEQLESCNSVSSITAILQEQAQRFRELRGNDGRLIKALNSSVDVLCAPSINSALNEAIGVIVRQVSLGTDYPLYNPLTLGLAYVMLYVMIHSMKKKT